MPTPRTRSPFALSRWTAEDAREVIAALNRSGQAVTVFAAEHGLDTQRVYGWRRRLRASSAGAEPTRFRELMVRPSIVSGANGVGFEIVLRSGTTVRVPASFDPGTLERLLDVLARAGAC